MAINTGKQGAYDPNAILPRAYHLEVAEDQTGRVSTLLQQDYSSQQKESPMDIKMIFVPDVNTLMNHSTRAKTAQVVAQQLGFKEKMGYINSWEIINLFPKNKDTQILLASMITQILSTKLPHLNVFHAVSPGYR